MKSPFKGKAEGYWKFLGFMLKYWNNGMFTQATANAFQEGSNGEAEGDFEGSPKEFVEDLKGMGPTYIKLGQLLSTRSDLLPRAYLNALSELQDNVPPIEFSEIREVVESELGMALEAAFREFHREPLACASIGQVHRAVLHDGEAVAVKVQRPGIRERFAQDIQTLEKMISLAVKHSEVAKKYAFDDILDEMRQVLWNELDYELEAGNLLELHHNLERFEDLVVPLPILDHSSKAVLCMQFIDGTKITEVPTSSMEPDPGELAQTLVTAYLQQILKDGFVHVDPHPGNVLYTRDHKIALIDLGMVARFSKNMGDHLIQLLLALTNRDSHGVAGTLLALSEVRNGSDLVDFKKEIGSLVVNRPNGENGDMEVGRMLIRLNRIAAEHYVGLPMAINILGKVLLNLEPIIMGLQPSFNLQEAIEKNLLDLFKDRVKEDFDLKSILPLFLDGKRLAHRLPKRLDDISRHFAENNFKIRIEAINEKRVTDGFQKVANRIALGLIIAAMILGAALLMQLPSDYTVLGYPALAMVFFLLAVLGGIALSLTMLFNDEKSPPS